MRGTRHCAASRAAGCGIIPAYAGNTEEGRAERQELEDHPRICGEHVSRRLMGRIVKGSSPHMRGTHFSGSLLIAWLGIIPAYAGNAGDEMMEKTFQ